MGDAPSPPDLSYEQHWKALERVFPGVGFIFDREGRYVDVISSEDTHPLLYAPPEELRSRTLHETLPGEKADYILGWIRRTLDANEVKTIEYELDVQAGTRWFEASFVPLPAAPDGSAYVQVLARDVTGRKTREAELRTYRRRFEAVFNDPHVLIGILDVDGTVDRINRTALDLVDAGPEALTGEPFWETPWWTHSPDLQRDLRQWIDRAAAGEYVEFEAEHYTATGERILVDGFLRPVVDDDGEVVSIIVSAHDVTSRTRHRQRLQVLHRVLRHNLRNSLNTISGYAEEMQALLADGPVDDDLVEMARMIEGEGTDLADLVEKIQPVRTIETGGPRESVAVETLLSDAAAAARGPDPSATVDVTPPSTGVEVPRSVEVAVFEAVENALVHHDHESGAPTVRLSAEVDPDAKPPQVVLTVADDGPGVPETEVDPLETGGETALQHTSGVGLWLMKWTVESEGGELALTRNAPRGSTVEITLPCTVTAE